MGVETCCIGNSCLRQTSFRALIDSGQSFTYLPEEIYRKVAVEIDRHVNATIKSFEGVEWEYCYETRYTTSINKGIENLASCLVYIYIYIFLLMFFWIFLFVLMEIVLSQRYQPSNSSFLTITHL